MSFTPKPNISDESSQKEISAEIETVGNVQQHRNRIVFEQKNEAPKPTADFETSKSTITAQVKAVLAKVNELKKIWYAQRLRDLSQEIILKQSKLDYSTAGILLGLKNSGCPFNMTRHIKVEDCSGQGFYDYSRQSISICQELCFINNKFRGFINDERILSILDLLLWRCSILWKYRSFT